MSTKWKCNNFIGCKKKLLVVALRTMIITIGGNLSLFYHLSEILTWSVDTSRYSSYSNYSTNFTHWPAIQLSN